MGQKRLFWRDSSTGALTPIQVYSVDTTAVSVLQRDKQDKTDSSLDTSAKTVVGGINELNELVGYKLDAPAASGTAGQILTVDEDGSIAWKDPYGLETVTVQLSVESGSGSVADVSISVQVEGESDPRYYTTDSTGKASFNVTYGLSYTVSFSTISGYLPLTDVTYRAALNVRTIYGIYKEDSSVSVEHLVISLQYTTGTEKATMVDIVTSAGTTSYTLVNDQCEADVSLGTAYSVKFRAVSGYATPASQSYTAKFSARMIKGYYVGAVTGLTWIKKSDGSTIQFDSITLSDVADVAGLRISSSLLAQQNASFLVPMEYLVQNDITVGGVKIVTKKSIGSKQWGPQVLLDSLPCYTSESACLTSDSYRNFDGENNTGVYLEEAETKEIELPAMSACTDVSYEIAGIVKTGFLGSYAQMKAFSDNCTSIDTVMYELLGVHCIAVNSGYWWSSTQYSATYAVLLDDGRFPNLNKTNNYSVVPLLAY